MKLLKKSTFARAAGSLALAGHLLLGVAEPAAAQVVAKVGAAYGDESHPQIKMLLRWAQLVKERTDGGVEIQIFPGGQLGGEVEMAEGLRLGSLQGALVAIDALSGWVPQGGVFSMPFIFRSDDHALAVYNGPFADRIAAYYPPQGFDLLGFWLAGKRNPMGKVKIQTPADVVGKTLRVVQSPLHIDVWKAVGANPTPIPFPEVPNAIQAGTIDFFDGVGSTYYSSKFYEFAPFYSDLGHIYAIMTMVVSDTWWQTLTPEQQAVLKDSFRELAPVNHHVITYENVAGADKAGAASATITVVKDKAPWQAAMKPVWDKWAGETADGQELIDAIVAVQ
jgi:TRAP-type C4-dicarboxylate transport system substrate-binding protein